MPRVLLSEAARARELGYVVESEQARVGFVSVAVPVYGTTGPAVAALSVTAPLHRAETTRYASLLRQVSRRFSLVIGATAYA
ncbi:hypothetical protein KVH15_22040 [Streptomyces olivaceus]|nr:IclR family transcriptional regulator C-terminal domain-containing protein [Streptomyces olivaceus]MBZ6083689.1 hypothetical protein [Streptomyces olivaceus]